MNIFKLFYPKRSIKRKILDIKDDIESIIFQYCEEKFWIHWYGAYEIDPKHLIFWICVKSDLVKSTFILDSELMMKLRALLVKHDYPESARLWVSIDFESQETVDRESNGNWYYHFK